jgi:lysophospholipase L1-like esterase
VLRLSRWCLVVATAVAVACALVLGAEARAAALGPQLAAPLGAPDDAPAGPPPAEGGAAASVVWLGDSTAAGVGASGPRGTLPEQVATLLAQPVRLTVLARSGARVSDILRTQLPQVGRLRPTEVFISVGANDATHLTWRSRFRRDYGRLVAGLPSSVVRVVLLGVPDMGAPPRLAQPLRSVAGWRGRALATDVRNLARRRHAIFVDIAAVTGPTFRRQPGRYFASDRYHPNDPGYGLWATAVAAAVRNAP